MVSQTAIVFLEEDDLWRVRVGDIEVVIEGIEEGAPVLTLYGFTRVRTTPCDEEWADGACPDSKIIESQAELDMCEKVCPYKREFESVMQSCALWGSTFDRRMDVIDRPDRVAALTVLAEEARRQLRDERSEHGWDAEAAIQLTQRSWAVAGVLLAPPQIH